MPTFQYKARDNQGNIRTGSRNANSADALGAQLLAEDMFPTEIKLIATKEGWWARYLESREPKPTTTDLNMFCRQMYTLTKAGVSISNSFRQLADSTKNKVMHDALLNMADNLEAGVDLASAMQNNPKVFSPFMVSMIRVGQASGRLPEAFLRINQYMELEGGAIRNLSSTLRYPLFVMIAIIIAIVLINIFVIPSFSKVFSQSNMKLPAITEFLVSSSHFFVKYWVHLLIVTGAVIFGLRYYVSTPKGKYLWHQFQFKLPIFGSIVQRIVLLRFTQSFAITMNAGVSLIEGIGLVGQSIDNEYGKQKILSMQTAIERGSTLTQAASATTLFTPLELQMLSVSEETGELSGIMEQLAAHHRKEVEFDIKRISDLIEPMVIISLAGMILIIAFAVYLPIWNMAKLASPPS